MTPILKNLGFYFRLINECGRKKKAKIPQLRKDDF